MTRRIFVALEFKANCLPPVSISVSSAPTLGQLRGPADDIAERDVARAEAVVKERQQRHDDVAGRRPYREPILGDLGSARCASSDLPSLLRRGSS
jgi:hypothetical protein